MGASQIISSLPRGRWYGSYGVACCPAHNDHTPSLSIRETDDGKILVRCHAGCDQERVIAALQSRGLWKGNSATSLARSVQHAATGNRPDRESGKRNEAALRIWQAAGLADGTVVETYLASRGLHLSIPQAIRSHSGLRHQSGDVWPAMVALVTRGTDDKALGIHRTFLARDGSGKAPVDPQKMMLGPCRGGAVKLASASDVLMIGEGLETCLAAMQASDLPAWAALSTSGLRSLDLPSDVYEVIVLADGDNAGETAAQAAAQRWKRQGRLVRIARPPRGFDFNDILMSHVTNLGEAA